MSERQRINEEQAIIDFFSEEEYEPIVDMPREKINLDELVKKVEIELKRTNKCN